MKLTDIQIKRIKPTTTPYKVSDGGGLFLWVTPSGSNGPPSDTEVYIDGDWIGAWEDGTLVFAGKDWIGTKRYESLGQGSSISEVTPITWKSYTSLPFGDNLSSIGQDSTHFTGKERDTESGLDYFGARYYSSSMGRFSSPDPLGPWVADVRDPQSWNMYAYARNNPLVNTDPTGYDCVYFNDAGTGLDTTANAQGQVNPIDRNSNSTECGKTGGDWVNGTFTGMTADANNDHFDLRSVDANGTYDAIATAPGSQSDGTGCTGNCESDYNFNPAPGYVPQEDIAPSAQVFINQVAGLTGGVTRAGNCAGAAALAFSPVTTPDDAREVGSALTDQGVDATKEGMEALSDAKILSKGARVGANYLGKAAGVAGTGLAVHSAYKNMKEAGCFGKKD